MRTSSWKVVVYAIIVLSGIVAVLPNFVTREQLAQLPDWVPKKQIVLGLDLRGGSQLLLEIDSDAVLQDRLKMIGDGAEQALRSAKVATSPAKVGGDAVSL